MAWMERFSLMMRSSVTVIREQFAQPERMLHQLLIDMEEELEAVRHTVAEAVADEILLRKKMDAARAEAEQWLVRAKSAIERSDEKTAQAALQQKLRATERADQLTKEYETQEQQTKKLREAVRDLEDKIRQARQRQTLLLARMSRAESSRQIKNVLDQAGNRSAFAEFQRMEAKVDRAEALAEAYERIDGHDPDAEELERKFLEQKRSDQVQQELQTLRQTVQAEESK